jgi:hypothetical protein
MSDLANVLYKILNWLQKQSKCQNYNYYYLDIIDPF